ncbi:MAG TPA: hypothetical protein VII63_07020 [Caulobacteraceae bacterium]
MRHSSLLSAVAAVLAIYLIVRGLLIAAVWIVALVIALAFLVVVGLARLVVLPASSRRAGARSFEPSPPVKALKGMETREKVP